MEQSNKQVAVTPRVTGKSALKAKLQFERTVRRTGKWRGMTPERYKLKFGEGGFRSGTSIKECEHFFSDFFGANRCIHCLFPFRKYVLAHPKKFPKIANKIRKFEEMKKQQYERARL